MALKLAVLLGGIVATLTAFMFSPAERKISASASGPAPTYTGAPGESNCTACHSSFEANSGTGSVTISGLPANYLPGQQIPITVTTSQADAVLYGFQMTALDHDGGMVGTYTIPDAMPPIIQTDIGFVNGVERQYIEHTINGITPTVFGSKSWQFTWTAPSRRVGKVGFYAAGNGADSDGGTGGDYIYTTSGSILSGSAISSFDGDGKSEVAVYRPSEGAWYSVNSSDGQFQASQWGLAEDIVTPGDFDGDGVTDRAVFRPSTGFWYLLQSTNGIEWIAFGQAGDIPVAGDYDGDLKTDIAVFRPSTGYWYIRNSTGGISFVSWGLPTDTLVPGDYDGDAKTDVAVFRPSDGYWYILQSSDGIAFRSFGQAGDKAVPADYDGDGRTDVAVFRPSDGYWYVSGSTAGFAATAWGLSDDVMVPADYDGDGKSDIAVFRPSDGVWYIRNSSDSSVTFRPWGQAGDVPVASGYIH